MSVLQLIFYLFLEPTMDSAGKSRFQCTCQTHKEKQEKTSPDLVTLDLVKNLDLVKFSLLTEFLSASEANALLHISFFSTEVIVVERAKRAKPLSTLVGITPLVHLSHIALLRRY